MYCDLCQFSDKSQGSVAARLRCGGLFGCDLTMYLPLSLLVKKK